MCLGRVVPDQLGGAPPGGGGRVEWEGKGVDAPQFWAWGGALGRWGTAEEDGEQPREMRQRWALAMGREGRRETGPWGGGWGVKGGRWIVESCRWTKVAGPMGISGDAWR